MSAIKIISADERLRKKHGVKILLLGPPGMGKTSQLRTLPDLDRAVLVESEAAISPSVT
jgi:stage III sporulation protein SpoIIIAA